MKKAIFVNFSNHPSAQWSQDQKQEALTFGEIRDVAFPVVSPMATTEEVAALADHYTEEICKMDPACVMCQGEFSLAVAVIGRLQGAGICCVCACSERKVVEEQMPDGTMKKTSVFVFRQFREYEKLGYTKGERL